MCGHILIYCFFSARCRIVEAIRTNRKSSSLRRLYDLPKDKISRIMQIFPKLVKGGRGPTPRSQLSFTTLQLPLRLCLHKNLQVLNKAAKASSMKNSNRQRGDELYQREEVSSLKANHPLPLLDGLQLHLPWVNHYQVTSLRLKSLLPVHLQLDRLRLVHHHHRHQHLRSMLLCRLHKAHPQNDPLPRVLVGRIPCSRLLHLILFCAIHLDNYCSSPY